MGYSVKWIAENLGITRDMLRYYEKEKLIPIAETRNPSNNYRNFSEEDIKRIWGIKLLIGIGFSAKEIRDFFNASNFSFYDAISVKVKQLKKRMDELSEYLEFAKTIEITGRIPYTTQVGTMKFEDFIEYCHQHWNVFNDPQGKKIMMLVDDVINKPVDKWDDSALNRLIDFYNGIDPEQMVHIQTIAGYFRVIADMMPLGYENEVVQSVVKCLYEYNLKIIEPQYQEQFTPLYFADHTLSSFVESDLGKINERIFGKEGCMFIVQALAHFGGYDFDS